MKKVISVSIILLILISAAGCAKKIELEADGAERISVLSFETGKTAETSQKDIIADITNEMYRHKFTKDLKTKGGDNINYEFASGYHITWYDSDGNISDEISVLSNSRIYHDGFFYDKEKCKCAIDTSLIELMLGVEGVRSFSAFVLDKTDSSLLVEPAEWEFERKSSGKIWVHLKENNWDIYPGSIVRVTYGGAIMESDPAQIDAYKCEMLTDARNIKYFGSWIDRETAQKQDSVISSDLKITAIFSDCFFASSVYPLPDRIKINGKIGDDWCVGDQVLVEYSNIYSDPDHAKTEGDLVSIKQSTLTLDPNVADKPVIYLYPEEDMDITVKLDLDGKLTCTYPDYGEGWTVTARPDGTLTDKNGQSYNYLYWEGNTFAKWDMSRGFCVKGGDTARFLEDALERLGLNRREANEFIVFWLPLMQDNPYNIISFQSDAYTEAARLEIEPSPDTLIRVFMAYKPSDQYIDVSPQALTAPERIGFTAVEWGGTMVN